MSADLRKVIPLLGKPLAYTVVYTIAWILVHLWQNYQIVKEIPALSPVMDCLGAIIGGTYGLHALFASFSLNRISNKHDTIEHADAMGDLDEFMFYRNRRSLNLMWRMLLLAQTVILLFLLLLAPIPLLGTSTAFLGFGSLPIFLFWEVAVELDDPFKGYLRIELYHPEWRDLDPGQYFREKASKAPAAAAA
ncbi:MAG: hypothetical protein ACM3NH_04660 [Candidatus Saccharibacteria bacterium]